MGGWIKIYRNITNHWIWDNPIYLKAWLGILLTVNHEDKKVLIQGELFECKRGQSLLSLSGWVKLFGKKWTMQRVRKFFELLKKDQMIITKGLQKTTCLTVCNYDNYQELQQANNKQTTSKQQANNKQTTTNKNNKNNKNDKNKKNIYNIFYDAEILKSNNDPEYLILVKQLFGENNLGISLNCVLKMETQLSYEQFTRIQTYKKKYTFSIIQILEAMENWGNPKKYKTVYGTFQTFLKNELKIKSL